MNSIYDLKTENDISQVSNTSKYYHQRITPELPITDPEDFLRGDVVFKWSNSNPKQRFIPDKCYMKCNVEISSVAGNILNNAEVAPSMNLSSSLFRGVNLSVDNHNVELINDNLAQIDTYKKRLQKNNADVKSVEEFSNFFITDYETRKQLINNSGVLLDSRKSTNSAFRLRNGLGNLVWNVGAYQITGVNTTFETDLKQNDTLILGDYVVRVAAIVNDLTIITDVVNPDGVIINTPLEDVLIYRSVFPLQKDTAKKTNTIIFKPMLSFFENKESIPGGEEWQLRMMPNVDYKISAIESATGLLPNVDYDVKITDMQLYVAMIENESEQMTDKVYYLENDYIECVDREIVNNITNENYIVDKHTHMISVALQNYQRDTQYPISKFLGQNNNEKSIRQIRLTYNQENKPNITPDILYSDEEQKGMIERYYYNLLQYSKAGDYESYSNWLNRGPYYSFSFLKNQFDESQDMQLYLTLDDITNLKLLLFTHYKRITKMTLENGRYVNVYSESA